MKFFEVLQQACKGFGVPIQTLGTIGLFLAVSMVYPIYRLWKMIKKQKDSISLDYMMRGAYEMLKFRNPQKAESNKNLQMDLEATEIQTKILEQQLKQAELKLKLLEVEKKISEHK